jgi:hypothetical protein
MLPPKIRPYCEQIAYLLNQASKNPALSNEECIRLYLEIKAMVEIMLTCSGHKENN